MENKNILRSWKEISLYLNQDIRTCQRWETELGLPVRRIKTTSPRSKVFAYQSEIDLWLKEKAKYHLIKKKLLFEKSWAHLGLVLIFALLAIIFASLYFAQKKTIFSSFKSLSLAVLPFEILNGAEHDEYFSEGLTDQIINNLNRHKQLQIIPVAAELSNNPSLSTKKLCKKINADYLLAAKTERDDTKIRIYARLIRTKDAKDIMEEVFEDRLGNLFLIEENLCSKIQEKLNLLKSPSFPLSPSSKQSIDNKAFYDSQKKIYFLSWMGGDGNNTWKLCLKAKYYSEQCTKYSNDFAVNLFQKAIEIDKNCAEAYIGLARCYSNYVNFGWNSSLSWLNKAEELLQKANTISPGLADYYSTLIEVYSMKELAFNEDTKKLAFELAQEGIKKYPNHAQLNSINGYLCFRKFGEDGNEADLKKAIEFKEKSFWLNISAPSNFLLATYSMLNHEFDRAIEYCNIAKSYSPPLMADFVFGEIYYYKGDIDKSKAIFQQLDSPIEYKADSMPYLGMIAAQKGDRDEAQRIIQEIEGLSPGNILIFEHHLRRASIYMGLGEKELGFDCLKSFFSMERAKKMRHVYHKYIELDKNFDRVRKEEKFKKIINS